MLIVKRIDMLKFKSSLLQLRVELLRCFDQKRQQDRAI